MNPGETGHGIGISAGRLMVVLVVLPLAIRFTRLLYPFSTDERGVLREFPSGQVRSNPSLDLSPAMR